MERWLKSGWEEHWRGQRAAGTDSERVGSGYFLPEHHHCGVHAPVSERPDELGSGAVDLTLWPSGERSLGLGNNLGFIQQEAVSPPALCLIIIVWPSVFRPQHKELSLLTPSKIQ